MGTVKFTGKTLPKVSGKEWERLDAITDEEIDCSEIPEFEDMSGFHPWEERRMYKPVKVTVTCKLDADIVAWLKREGKGYQTRMNAILRNAMENVKAV
jgi:uncharacterized protein (DUF4415 family)